MPDLVYPGNFGVTSDDLVYPPASFAIATLPGSLLLSWPAASGTVVANGSYVLALAWPWTAGTILGLTGQCAVGSFMAAVQIANATCAQLLVNTPRPVSAAAAANVLGPGTLLTLLISAAAGMPTDAVVQVNYNRSIV